MIASLQGVVTGREGDVITLETDGGVGYALRLSTASLARLPASGQRVRFHTELVVREDEWSLYGFESASERDVFRRLLGAAGVGPRLALALISELGAARVVRAIRERDLTLLSSVTGIGRKKAERLALELADRLDEVAIPAASSPSGNADAVRALMALGYTAVEADDAVRVASRDVALDDTPQLIRRALASLAVARSGR